MLQQALEIDVHKRITVRELTKLLQNILHGKPTTRNTTRKHLRQTERRRQIAQQQKRKNHTLVAVVAIISVLFIAILAFSSPQQKQQSTPQSLEQAQQLLEKQQYAAAKDLYQRLLKTQPKNTQLHQKLATVCELMREHNAALDYLDQAIQISEYDARLYYARSKILRTINELQRAIQDAQKAINLSPENADNYLLLANLYQDTQQHQKAKKNLRHRNRSRQQLCRSL